MEWSCTFISFAVVHAITITRFKQTELQSGGAPEQILQNEYTEGILRVAARSYIAKFMAPPLIQSSRRVGRLSEALDESVKRDDLTECKTKGMIQHTFENT